MTYAIVWEPPAVDTASRFLADEPDGRRALFTAIDALSSDPQPAPSFPFGSPNLRRIRVGRYRALHQVSDDEQLIVVTHLGRNGQPHARPATGATGRIPF